MMITFSIFCCAKEREKANRKKTVINDFML
jgi:hypothetical protein